MLNGINIEDVRKYNTSLKQYKDQSARLMVEIEMNEKELTQLCEQLTQELGKTVTPDNVEDIYNEQVEKINQTLETGNAILKKIEQEASGTSAAPMGVVNQPAASIPVAPVAPTGASIPVAPTGTIPTPPVIGGVQQGTLFTGQSLGNIDKLPQPTPANTQQAPLNSGTPFFNI